MSGKVLVVEDDASLREALCDTLALAGFDCVAAADGGAALALLRAREIALVISDVQMPGLDGYGLLARLRALRADLPVLLMTAYGSVPAAVQAMREGAADYLVKPFEPAVLVAKVSELMPNLAPGDGLPIAVDPHMLEVLALARRVAERDTTVLLTGESGAGKEVLFRYLHAHSRRAHGPAIAINCAAIPENMLEAILFGYEKGAFTGAYKAAEGKFEQAQGGTLLLDEISEMSLTLQAKLLRVVQEREVERLGASRPIALDVRVIATSNRDLRAAVAAGQFREDLYYRLNVFPIRVPALRERPDDIVPLARHLLLRAAAASGCAAPSFTPAALEALRAWSWPGNVRELDNVVQRALVIADGRALDAADLCFEGRAATSPVAAAPAAPVADAATAADASLDLRARERRTILDALLDAGGSRKRAAERLGISARTLRYKLARMREEGLEVPTD